MKEAYAVRRTVPPSAEIQASIDKLLSKGMVDDPQKMLSELARLGARLIIQRAVEDEFDTWLGRARYERRPEGPAGKRNGFRPRHLQTGEVELRIEIPQAREAAMPFVSKLFPKWHCKRLLRTDPLKALVIGGVRAHRRDLGQGRQARLQSATSMEGERGDSNPRPPGPQPGALPAELRPPCRVLNLAVDRRALKCAPGREWAGRARMRIAHEPPRSASGFDRADHGRLGGHR